MLQLFALNEKLVKQKKSFFAGYLRLMQYYLDRIMKNKINWMKKRRREMLLVNLKQLMLLKSAREKKRIYYKEVSKETGISVSTLSRIASNPKYNVSKEHIEKLCKYFDVTPDQLMTIIPDPPDPAGE